MNELDLKLTFEGGAEHALAFDPSEYVDYMAGFDLTDAQQVEVLQTLWHIMVSMVDMGWGVDNIQLMLPDVFNQEAEADTVTLTQPIERKERVDDL